MSEINYTWNIKDLTKKEKHDIKERIETKISEISGYENFNVEINKIPNGGADILIKYNKNKLTFEGKLSASHSPVSLILWADNPLPVVR